MPTWSPDVQPGVYLSADVGLLLNVCVSECVSGNVGEARIGYTGTRDRHVARGPMGDV